MEKQTLTIRVSSEFCNRLRNGVGRGKMGKFIEEVVGRELAEQETNLAREYQKAYQNPRLLELARKWEKVDIESWRNYEKERNKN